MAGRAVAATAMVVMAVEATVVETEEKEVEARAAASLG